MASTDDESGSTNWREKYLDVANMLAETRAELDDFQHSSKELEEELERELERTERAQEDLKNRIARAESEREDWKNRFMSLQTTHNTTTTSLQRELDQLRQTHHQLKSQMRELEIGNDDLEGRERAITSSLNDLESRYGKVLEEKILLEQELLDKASLEEECQRLKDDKRDLNEEVDVLKEQIADARAQLIAPSASSYPSTNSSNENLMQTAVPDTLRDQLRRQQHQPATFEDESPIGTSPSSATVSVPESAPSVGQSPVYKRAGFKPGTPGAIPRSVTMPTTMSPSPSRLPMTRPPRMQTTTAVPRVSSFNAAVPSVSKSKGVQMVSEMRTRVKALEQKIHSRVPRLRIGSISGRGGSSDSMSKDVGKVEKTKTKEKEKTKETPDRPGVDGWVLIMEENTPIAQRHRRSADSGGSLSSPERRRSTSPSDPPSSFRRHVSQSIQSPIPAAVPSSSRSASGGLRRPASRLSASTDGGRSSIGSTISTSSAASTVASSRPCTPTFLPVPTGGLRSSTSVASSGPRRSSLGTTQNSPSQPPSPRKRPTSVPMAGLPFLNTSNMDTSQPRYRRGTPSPTKEMPPQESRNPLSTSRIGRLAAAPSAFASMSRRAQDDSVAPAPGAPAGTTTNGHLKLSRFRSGSFRS